MGAAVSIQKTCPRCKTENVQLDNIPGDLVDFLIDSGVKDALLGQVCPSCISEFEGFKGNPLLIKEKVNKQQLKVMRIWKSRGDHLKNAMHLFKEKQFDECVTEYEKYVKALEVTFGVTQKGLNSKVFIQMGKSDEIATYALVLWDLILIFEGKNSSKATDLMGRLVDLVKGTSLMYTLQERTKNYEKTSAKDKKLFRTLYKNLGGKSSWIF